MIPVLVPYLLFAVAFLFIVFLGRRRVAAGLRGEFPCGLAGSVSCCLLFAGIAVFIRVWRPAARWAMLFSAVMALYFAVVSVAVVLHRRRMPKSDTHQLSGP